MKIAIDCRLVSQTGVGRYIRALLKELKIESTIKTDNEYYLIAQESDRKLFFGFPSNVKIVSTDAGWHSFKEQIEIPKILYKNKIDLVHFPYFNVPLLTFPKFIVTIHDLTINKFKTGKSTTLPRALFLFKKLSYFLIMWFAVRRAKKILTVSETVKREIVKTYGVEEEKIKVIYNGSELEADGQEVEKNVSKLQGVSYILYVGNLHPHKNVENLILAYDLLLKNEKLKNIKLVIVSPFDFFYKRLFIFIKKLGLEKKVEFTGPIDNGKLENLYKNAECLVFPSKSEGFGIPGVEAMRFGCPVVASDLSIFHEIYNEAAIYFNPENALDLSEKISLAILNTNLRSKLYLGGLEQSKKYSWTESAKQILKEYETRDSLRQG